MKKNKLYTVNKWNQPAFMSANRFDWGGLAASDKKANPWNYADDVDTTQQYMNSKNTFGISKTDNPFSKGNLAGGLGAMAKTPVGGALVGGLAGTVGQIGGNLISGGLQSDVGNAIGSIGGTVGSAISSVNPVLGGIVSVGSGLIGGAVNGMFGTKVDEAKLRAANEGTAAYNNFQSNATSFDDVKGPTAQANVQDAYSGGLFSSGSADEKNEALKRARVEARQLAFRAVNNNINNLVDDQINDALANYSAFGGPLNTGALGLMQQNRYFDSIDKRSEAIAEKNGVNTAFTGGAKTFDTGGLKWSFLNEFGTDPIGAVVRYNQGLEDMAAREELLNRSREQAMQQEALQQQMDDLRLTPPNFSINITQDYGVNGVPGIPQIDVVPNLGTLTKKNPEIPASPSTPSTAASGSTWDYIEDQLHRSGKFNDVQIQGIKYNLQRESGIDPTVVGDGGQAFGLGQWHGSRQPKDRSLAGQTQHLIDTLSNFDGAEHWVNKRDYQGFLNARTPEEAHYYIAKGYERPRADIVAKVKRDSDMSLRKLNAFGGELGTNGTDWTNGLLYIDEGGSHEENPLEGVPMGLDPQGIPNLVEEGETVYNDYVFSDRMKVPFFMYKELGLGGVMKKKGKEMSFADASKKLAQESEQRPNDPISKDGLEASLTKLAEVQEAERMRKQGKEYMGLEGYACGGKMGNKFSGTDSNNPYGSMLERIKFDPEKAAKELEEVTGKREATPAITDAIRQGAAMQGYNPDMGLGTVVSQYNPEQENNPKTYDTWMRYAPAVGAGVMTLTDMLGLTNRPDYTYAGKLEAAAERAGYAPNIDYKPIGNYLTYRPMDIWYQQNALNAQSRATDRALMNTSGGNRGTAMAGLLANGYNSQVASGNLYRQALEYNDAKRKDVAEFNRKTNMFNSQMDLEAAMANARYQQAARQMGLSGLAQAAALRDSIDARVGASRSANLTNFLTSLGNIGRENFALNQINWDRSRHYGTDASGRSSYKRKNE